MLGWGRDWGRDLAPVPCPTSVLCGARAEVGMTGRIRRIVRSAVMLALLTAGAVASAAPTIVVQPH